MEIGLKITKNSNKFRQPALYFQDHGVYTYAPPGTSEFIKYWTVEAERCIHGFTAEDGDRIPGYFYFYLNYFQINLVKEVEIEIGGKVSKRIVKEPDFPFFYDYDRFFFEAVELGENLGKHLIVLKARRKGYSYKVASMLARNFYFYKNSKNFALASEAEYLVKDGILTKTWDGMDFVDQNTAWFKKRQKVDTKMHKRASFIMKDESGVPVELGYKSEIMGITLKNDPQKARGKCFGRDTKVILADGSIGLIQDIKIGDLVMGPDGQPRVVKETHCGIDNLYKISPSNGDIQIVNSEHDIYHEYLDWKFETSEVRLIKPTEYMALTDSKQARSKLVKVGIDYTYNPIPIDPYFLGLWLGDGSIGKTEIISEDTEVIDYVKKYSKKIGGSYYCYSKTTNPKVFSIGITGGAKGVKRNLLKNKLRELGIYRNKRIPQSYLINSKEIRLQLLAGLVDTDGYYDKDNNRIEIIQKRKELSEDIVYLSRSLGIKTSINEKWISGYGVYYRICLFNSLELIPTLLKRKQSSFIKKPFVRDPLHSTFKIEEAGVGEYYGFTVDKDNLFLLGDFTISHNSGKLIIFEEAGKFPHLLQTWQIARPSVEQGSNVVGMMIAFGTGGTQDADYEGLKELFERPNAYNCMTFKNIWDEHLYNTTCGFFIPQYANLEGSYYGDDKELHGTPFMDEDGNTNVYISKKYILEQRQKVIDNASDKRAIDRHIAEQPITPAEATLNISSNIFPKAELQKHLSFIRNNENIRNLKQVGILLFDSQGKLRWEINKNIKDLTKYRLDPGDDPSGAIVIWEHPPDEIPYGLYVIGVDPYDHDQSGTNSLGSAIVYKRIQSFEEYYNMPVAEYTGRPENAEMFYENVRKLALYYNAKVLYENEKKGLFTYFSHKHSEYLLADQPDTIKDIIQDSKVRRNKGIHMNTAIKDWGEGLIKDWLTEEYAPGMLNLTKIFSEPLLEELIAYSSDGNFDRVMAYMMVMIYIQELHHITVKKKKDANKRILFEGGLFRNNNEHKLII